MELSSWHLRCMCMALGLTLSTAPTFKKKVIGLQPSPLDPDAYSGWSTCCQRTQGDSYYM